MVCLFLPSQWEPFTETRPHLVPLSPSVSPFALIQIASLLSLWETSNTSVRSREGLSARGGTS